MSQPSDVTPDTDAVAAEAAPDTAAVADAGAELNADAPPAEGEADAGETPPRYRLPQAAIPPNIALQAAVTRLVEQKERIDQIVRDGVLDGLLPAEWSAAPGAELRAFIASVVPFASDSNRGDTISARVPLKYLLGRSQHWGKADVVEPKSLSVYLASDDRGNTGAKDMAEVMLLGPLGLAWAHAGRSRVGFLRAMGVESMAARVTALPYPAPQQLALFQVNVAGSVQVWCVLDSRRLRVLAAPSLTVPLLTAYGVAAPQAWPEQWPDPIEVQAEINTARAGKGVPEVDLVKLAEKIQRGRAGDTWISSSFLQLGTWVPRWRFFLGFFVGLPVILLLIAALALPGTLEATAVAAAMGFGGGAIAALSTPWIFARRKHLR